MHKRRCLEILLDEIPRGSKEAYHLKRWRQQFEDVCKLMDSDAPTPLTSALYALDNSSPTTTASSSGSAPGQTDHDVSNEPGVDEDFLVAPLLLLSVDSELLELEARRHREAELTSIAKDVEELRALQMEIARLASDQSVALSQAEHHMSNAKAAVAEANMEIVLA